MMEQTTNDKEPLLQIPKETCWGRIYAIITSIRIEPLLAIYMIAEYPVGSIIHQYMYHRVASEQGYYPQGNQSNNPCLNNSNANHTTLGKQVNEIVSKWDMYLAVSQSCVNLISVFCLGSLSDKYGRRINFILPPIGDMIHAIFIMLIIKYNKPFPFMFLGLVKNLLGTQSLFLVGCFTYLSDTIQEKDRSFRMTLLEIVIYISGTISYFALGPWIKQTQAYWPPFILVICGKFLALLYALAFIPETLNHNRDGTATSESYRNRTVRIGDSLKKGLTFLYQDNGNGRRARVWILLTIYIVSFSLYAADLFHIFVLSKPLCWDPITYGNFSAYNLVIHCLGALFLTKVLGKVLSDGWQVIFGQISSIGLFVYWTFVSSTVMMYFVPVIGLFTFVVVPVCKAMLSKIVAKDEQGSLFAIYSCVQLLVSIVNSVTLTPVYIATMSLLHGRFTLMLTACCRCIGLLLPIIYIKKFGSPTDVTKVT